MDKIVSIVDFVNLIKKRAPMYIGGNTIYHLKAFIDGWLFGAEKEIKDCYILDDFQNWLYKKFSISSNQSWEKVVVFYSIDEHEALKTFFELFEEFIESTQ